MDKNATGQKKVYKFLVEYITEHLYAPSIREICDGCGYYSTSTVAAHLVRLQKKGLIELSDKFAANRCIKLVGYKLIKEEQSNGEKQRTNIHGMA